MYVLIDRQQMAITHKHADRAVLAALAWIECTNAAATIAIGQIRPWLEFTPLELQKIYESATGHKLQGYADQLASVVMEAARRMPETDAVLEEAQAQMRCVMDGDKSSFRYVRGAMKPEEVVGLFTADPLTVERNEAAEQVAHVRHQPIHPTAPSWGATAGDPGAGGTNAAPRAPRAPSAPRSGGTRDTIFAVADKLWEEAGKPTNLQEILKLRKQMMNVLEMEHQIKKTTSSNTLGDWQKARV